MKHLLTCAVLFMMTFMATAQPQVGAPQRPGDGDFRRGPMNNGLQELLEEQKEQREKTYRKVLSADQYQKWESFEAQREFRQMVDTPR